MDDYDFPGGDGDFPDFNGHGNEHLITIKGSIESIGVRPRYRVNLENFVRLHHRTTMHILPPCQIHPHSRDQQPELRPKLLSQQGLHFRGVSKND